MTFHTAKNYGALLQAYALQENLKKLGADARIIDYCPDDIQYSLIPYEKTFRGKLRNLLVLLHILEKRRKFKKFDDFSKENLIITDKYLSTQALYNNPPKAELYITGSDQVFNPNRQTHKKQAYFLDFTPIQTPKISYAASFGTDHIEEKYKAEIAGYLRKFDSLSVRENIGIKLISKLTGQEASETLDPTLLLDADSWAQVERPYKGLPQGYVLYYRLLGVGDDVAAIVAEKLKLPLVMITDSPQNKVGADFVIRDAGPGEFLWLYDNAEFIITNSFHGVAFSLIFNKQFLSCDKQKSTQIRALNLLEQLDLRSKIIFSDTLLEMENTINYDSVNISLKKIREKSNEFLLKWIN